MEFFVEGRHFANSLWAFTFAQIQADRMLRPVEVHNNMIERPLQGIRAPSTWHATAQPSNYVRSHLVPQS